MEMNRWLTLATPRARFLSLAVVLLFGRIAIADGLPPQLVSISAISSGATPLIVFSFDTDVHSYSLSTYTLSTITGGKETPQSPQLVIIDASSPNKISVPLNFAPLASADFVNVSVTLNDDKGSSIPIKSFYSLDLSFLKAVKGYQTSIQSLQADKQNLQASLTQCQTDRADLISKHSPSEFDYIGPDLVGPTTVILHFKTDVYATIQVTDQTMNKIVPSVGTDHHVKFNDLAPSTPHKFKAVAMSASGAPMADGAFTKIFTVTTPALVAFAPIITKLVASGPTSLTATVDFNPTGVLPPNLKGYIVLHCFQQVDASSKMHGQAIDVGDGGMDANGVPKGTPYLGAHDFPITGLTAGTTYLVTFTAYDDYGETSNFPLPGISVPTPNPTPPLGFTSPIAITMNTNTGLTVSWSANRQVKNTALTITLSDGTQVIPPIQKKPDSSNVSVTADINALSTILEKAQTSPKAPIITISMDDGTPPPNGSATVSMSVEFDVVAKTASATQPVQKAANAVGAAKAKNKGIDWNSIISTGLGILVKLI